MTTITMTTDTADDVQGHILPFLIAAAVVTLASCITPCPPKEDKKVDTQSRPRA